MPNRIVLVSSRSAVRRYVRRAGGDVAIRNGARRVSYSTSMLDLCETIELVLSGRAMLLRQDATYEED